MELSLWPYHVTVKNANVWQCVIFVLNSHMEKIPKPIQWAFKIWKQQTRFEWVYS